MNHWAQKTSAGAERFEFGPFQFQPDGRLYKHGNPVPISPKEREVLHLLVTAEGRIVTKDEILQTVWSNADISEASLTRCVHFLRNHLGKDPRDRPYIKTVYGRGYCLELPVRRVAADVRLLMLPFTAVSTCPTADYLCNELTIKVSHYLRQFQTKGITLIAYEANCPDEVSLLSSNNIAQTLNADFVLEGQLTREAESLTLQVALTRVMDGGCQLSQTFTDQESELDYLAATVGAAIASQIPQRRSPLQNPRLMGAAKTIPQAYEAYLEAHYLWRRRDSERMKRAIELFQLAIQWDPNYAQAYIGLASCYATLIGWTALTTSQGLPLVMDAIQRAEAIDPTTPGLQILRAAILSGIEWDFVAADKDFKAVFSEETADAEGLIYYGRHLLASGQPEAAVEVLQKVSELDPLSPLSYGLYGYALHCARRTDEALKVIHRGLELEADSAVLLVFQCIIASFVGLNDEALEAGQAALHLNPPLPAITSTYAYACACAGFNQEAWKYVKQANQQTTFPGKSLVALALIALGDRTGAINWLEQALCDRDIWLPLMSTDPRLDPIRSHPRVQQILQEQVVSAKW